MPESIDAAVADAMAPVSEDGLQGKLAIPQAGCEEPNRIAPRRPRRGAALLAASIVLAVAASPLGVSGQDGAIERLMRWRVRLQPAGEGWRDHRIGWGAGTLEIGNGWRCDYSDTRTVSYDRSHSYERTLRCSLGAAGVETVTTCRASRDGEERFSGQATLTLDRRGRSPTEVTFACGMMFSDLWRDSDRPLLDVQPNPIWSPSRPGR